MESWFVNAQGRIAVLGCVNKCIYDRGFGYSFGMYDSTFDNNKRTVSAGDVTYSSGYVNIGWIFLYID